MMKVFNITYLLIGVFLCSSLISQASAGGCWPCGGEIAVQENSVQNPSRAQKYWPGWERFNSVTGCYYCQDPYNQATGGGCIPITPLTTSCNNLVCSYSNDTNNITLAAPIGTSKATCISMPPVYLYYPFSAYGDLQCGCKQGVGNRDIRSEKRYSLRDDEFQLIAENNGAAGEKVAVEGKQYTVDCQHSLICDPSTGRTDCSTCNTCADNPTINCSDISGSSQSCPGFQNSPYGSNTCPMQQGGECGICKAQACSGPLSASQVCQGFFPCLECHVIDLGNGSQVCGAHVAPSSSQCFCATWETPLQATCSRQSAEPEFNRQGAQVGGGSSGWSASAGVGGIRTCAPWGSDVITMQCSVGQGSTCQLASVDDCLAGRAILPTACDGTYACGGHICGSTANSAYSTGQMN